MDLIDLHDVPRRLLTLSLGGAPFYAAASFLLTRSIYLLLGRRRYRPLKAITISAAILHIPGALLLLIELVERAHSANSMPDNFPITYLWIIPLVVASQAGLYGIPLVLLRVGMSWYRPRIHVIKTTFRVLLVALVLGTSLYVSGRVYHDLHHVEYATHRLHNNGASDTLRIAVIADIQADAFTDIQRVNQYYNTVKALTPDVILFAGDLATIMYIGSIEPASHAYGKTLRDIPAYGVLGDHDYWTRPAMVTSTLGQNGMYIGRNELITTRASGTQLNVLLIENFALSRIPGGTLDSLLALPREEGLDVAVVHHLENRLLERLKEADFDLIVTGHTHGGQIALDFYGTNMTAALLDIDRISGMNREYGLPIYTSNGLGMSTVPLRYNATPTIGLLEVLP
ncbi:MAG: hypothetical protein CL946_08200 [Ectothiorhodospiraceae bacterium]|nr:hypothetical protein [Ectothiorhodospiraceae bacterium]